jgi:hypothetical protein
MDKMSGPYLSPMLSSLAEVSIILFIWVNLLAVEILLYHHFKVLEYWTHNMILRRWEVYTHVSPKKILLIYRFERWQFIIIDRYISHLRSSYMVGTMVLRATKSIEPLTLLRTCGMSGPIRCETLIPAGTYRFMQNYRMTYQHPCRYGCPGLDVAVHPEPAGFPRMILNHLQVHLHPCYPLIRITFFIKSHNERLTQFTAQNI